MKFVILIAFIGILGALAAAGLFMIKSGSAKERGQKTMVRALTVRIGVSVALFLFIWLAYLFGWIEPTGLPLQR